MRIPSIINPIRKNAPFAFFMFVTGVMAASFTLVKSAAEKPYEYAWEETFLGVYLTCCMLMLVPARRWRPILRGIIYAIIYPLSVIDVYCVQKFDTAINPSLLTLVSETDTREAGEFLHEYLTTDILLTPVGLMLLIPLLHLLFTLLGRKVHIKANPLTQWMKSKPARWAGNIICTALVAYCAVVSWPNYERIYSLLSQKTIGDVEHRLTEKDHGVQFLPLYRAAFSINASRLASKQIDIIRDVVDNVRIDSCSVTSPNIVWIIGEAYNKYHSQLYGYDKETTPHQLSLKEKGELVSFDDVVSPWNLTSYVFKHVMSTYVVGDEGDWCDQPLIGAVFRKAGYHVTFITNEFLYQAKQAVYDFSGGFFLNDPKLSNAQFDTRNTELHPYDESLLSDYNALRNDIYGAYADSIDSDPVPHLTIFHMIGQHVGYRARCPFRKRRYKAKDYPERTDLTSTWKRNVADYDNATLYNDSVVSEIVKRFEGTNTIIIYMPDHGEEVHPKELPHFCGRMHSATIDKRLAREEFGIPFWIYATEKYRSLHPEIWQQVKDAHARKYMTDAMPHMLMYLAGIHCPYYREELNLLSPAYNEARPRILKHQTNYDSVTNAE